MLHRDMDLTFRGQDYEAALRIAERALDLARQHGIPPVPAAFEVWFAYAGRLNSTICDRIDRALDSDGSVPAALIHRLHDECLSSAGVSAGVTRLGDQMDGELAQAVDLIEDGMAASEGYAATIRRIDTTIRPGAGEAELRRQISSLRQANREHAERVSRFSDGVMALRAQFTSMQKELRELRQSVLIDHTTQLANRRMFDEALDAAMLRARRDRTGFGAIVADIDHFRAFNERWGKATGDQVVLRFAAVLRQSLREGDLGARFGGDAFALLLPGASLETARAVADRLRLQFGSLQLVRAGTRERVASLTASFGVTSLRPGDTALKLVARLEDYVLRAKEAGRNQVWSAE
ncbi:diguanylate cyclase [Limibaculum sp. FT325]|uniref:GGDEF domain-containing protein n=1 Tax=Thermohalobaculum sediminis TaxID=2939436 RepID=UPI0020BF9D01|nr:GGDEF domain-containing protein [Limibaculum sediminis]MCL5776397.1 diguanylate cyclase [Limibaculum sediminis]